MLKRWKLLLAVFLGLALIASACGDDDDDDSAGDDGTSTEETDAPDDGAAPDETEAPDETAAPDETDAPVELTASDRGVTETTITIGYGVADLDGLREAGLALPEALTTDHLGQRWEGFINEWGDINGRTVEYQRFVWDPVDPATMDDMCAEATLNSEIFLMVVGNGIPGRIIDCFIQADVPFIFGEHVAQALHDTGLLLTISPPVEITASAGISAALEAGQIPDGATLGILSGNEPSIEGAGELVDGILQDAGFTTEVVVVNTQQGDAGAINAESGAAVGTFQAAGVTHIVNLLPFTQTGGFWTAASAAGGFTYTQLDTASSTCTPFGASRTPAEAAGVPCVNIWNGSSLTDGTIRPDTEFEAECRAHFDELFVDAFPTSSAPGVPAGQVIETADGETLSSDFSPNECTLANLIHQALLGAGPDLTWESFYAAAQSLGDLPIALASNGGGSLSEGKTYMADFIHSTAMVVVPPETPRDENGAFNGCPAPVNCWVNVTDDWLPIAAG